MSAPGAAASSDQSTAASNAPLPPPPAPPANNASTEAKRQVATVQLLHSEGSLSLAAQAQRFQQLHQMQQQLQLQQHHPPPQQRPPPSAPSSKPSAKPKKKVEKPPGPKPKRKKEAPSMTDQEERRILEQSVIIRQADPSYNSQRFLAKLTLREKRRRCNQPQFDLDATVTNILNDMPKSSQLLSLYYPESYKSSKPAAVAPSPPAPAAVVAPPPPPPAATSPTSPPVPQSAVPPPAPPAPLASPVAIATTPAVPAARAPTPAPVESSAMEIDSLTSPPPAAPMAATASSPPPPPSTTTTTTTTAAAAAAAQSSSVATLPPPVPHGALLGGTSASIVHEETIQPAAKQLPTRGAPPEPQKTPAAVNGSNVLKPELPPQQHQQPPAAAPRSPAPPAPSPALQQQPQSQPQPQQPLPPAPQQQPLSPLQATLQRKYPAPVYSKPSPLQVPPPLKPPPTVTAKPPPLPMAVSESPSTPSLTAASSRVAALAVAPSPPPRVLFKDILSGASASAALLQPLVSNFSLRTLKPFIRRDYETTPPRLAVLQELRQVFRKRNIGLDVPPNNVDDSIDYCYLRPQYVSAVNDLLRMEFWPDIDVSEWVDLPEYSVVVMYRRLVIGCAFISAADVAVHPQWRSSGIGRFMIYQLIMACPNKDITLHVSVNNTAMILYQQFGFKPEQFIRNFYDKYLPPDSRQCRHAFHLRLRR